MAHFYGTVQGGRGEASRLGTKNGGLVTRAASWSGAIAVSLNHNEQRGVDEFEVRMEQHQGAGDYRVLAKGDVGNGATAHGHVPVGVLQIDEKVMLALARSNGATDVNNGGEWLAFSPEALDAFLRAFLGHHALHQAA